MRTIPTRYAHVWIVPGALALTTPAVQAADLTRAEVASILGQAGPGARADLSARLVGARLNWAKLAGADLEGASVARADFSNAELTEQSSDAWKAQIRRAGFPMHARSQGARG
jgi:hypothetical protein